MRTLERDTINQLTSELAQCADELAFWKYQATLFYACKSNGTHYPTEAEVEEARKYLEEAYQKEQAEMRGTNG